ncbi:MAG: hypothetical protein VB143_07575, partial [Burkholderia sp.]
FSEKPTMKRFLIRRVLMDEASGIGGDAGAGGGAAAASGATTAAAATGDASTTAAATVTALAAGAAAGDATTPTFDYLPEKFIVKGDDGTVNLEASTRKMAESYGNLERGRAADVPKTSAEYAVTVPEAMKDAVGDLAQDGLFTQFRDDMHGLGLSQKQFDGVMQRYFEMAPAIAAGGMKASAEQAMAALEKEWPDEGKRKENFKQAGKAAMQMARAVGVSFDELEQSGLGNHPLFIRIMASLGPEMTEDTSAGAAATGSSLMGEDAIKQIMASDAYRNEKNPGFKAAQATVRAHYERKVGKELVQ